MFVRLTLGVAVSALLFCIFATAGEPAACPAKIAVHEQLSTSPAGWTATYDNAQHQLAGITFYDGAPKENASLVYDDIARSAGKQVARWHFAPTAGRGIWIACRYSATS